MKEAKGMTMLKYVKRKAVLTMVYGGRGMGRWLLQYMMGNLREWGGGVVGSWK